MWNKIIIFCLLFSMTNSFAQTEGWLTGPIEVFELSIKEDRPIMVNFTGSDWCGWCIKLKTQVFQTKDFKNWAQENIILLEIDNPKRKTLENIYGISKEEAAKLKKENDDLQKALQVRGFPTIWIFSVKKENGKYQINTQVFGRYITKMGYMPSATAFIAKANENIERLPIIKKATEIGIDCNALNNQECEDAIIKKLKE